MKDEYPNGADTHKDFNWFDVLLCHWTPNDTPLFHGTHDNVGRHVGFTQNALNRVDVTSLSRAHS